MIGTLKEENILNCVSRYNTNFNAN